MKLPFSSPPPLETRGCEKSTNHSCQWHKTPTTSRLPPPVQQDTAAPILAHTGARDAGASKASQPSEAMQPLRSITSGMRAYAAIGVQSSLWLSIRTLFQLNLLPNLPRTGSG